MPIEGKLPHLSVELSVNNPFDLRYQGKDRSFSLAITEPLDFGHDSPPEAQDLLRTVMLAHLVGPHFPTIIDTNFPIESTKFLKEFYAYYGYALPVIRRSGDQIKPKYRPSDQESYPDIRQASAHSGGLDSVYRLMRLTADGQNVLAVHLRNLNPKGNSREAVASRDQCSRLAIPYQQIRLRNSSDNTGPNTMMTRDMFLGLVTAITAKPNQVSEVLIEGGMSPDPQTSHFSENTQAWAMFNQLLADVGLDTNIVGVDPGDIETVGEIISLEKELGQDILPLVQNCFCAPFQLPTNRDKWERVTPFLAEHSPPQWCGSCTKCRRMTLGRIAYHDPHLDRLPQSEITFFARDTYRWIDTNPKNDDLLSPSFRQHLAAIC